MVSCEKLRLGSGGKNSNDGLVSLVLAGSWGRRSGSEDGWFALPSQTISAVYPNDKGLPVHSSFLITKFSQTTEMKTKE